MKVTKAGLLIVIGFYYLSLAMISFTTHFLFGNYYVFGIGVGSVIAMILSFYGSFWTKRRQY